MSGAPIKLWLVRAMADTHIMFQKAHAGADRLLDVVRKADSLPPGTNGGHNPRESGR